MRNIAMLIAALSVGTGCGGPTAPVSPPPPTSAASSAAPGEPTVSNVIRTRLPKDTPCSDGDVCGFYLQVISPGSDASELTDKAMKILRGHCAGTIIVYRDKRGVMGAGSVFTTEDDKRACVSALGSAASKDDYPSSAVWRKAD